MKLKLFLLLLIPVFMNASDSKRLRETVEDHYDYTGAYFKIHLTNDKNSVLCTAEFFNHLQFNRITNLENKSQHNLGYGTRVFKRAIAEMHAQFPYVITFYASPQIYANPNDRKQKLKKLIQFYKRLGAKKTDGQKDHVGMEMYYPLERAAAMAALLPILEPKPIIQPKQLPNKSLAIKVTPHDPLLVIMSYIDEEKPNAEKQKEEQS